MLAAGLHPISGYCLEMKLGAGAFGEVWRAVKEDGTRAALKFIDCRTKPRGQIQSEIRILRGLSRLRHPHIIKLLGVHATSRYVVLEMELADGNFDDLRRAYVKETGHHIPPEHALELLDQVADGLDFLATVKLPGFNTSTRGLQHCDIKPSNLLLRGDQAKIADFGLAAGTKWNTSFHQFKGTAPYAAPELFRGLATPTTDQYGLAVTFCVMVAGSRLFQHAGSVEDGFAKFPVDLTKAREREVPILSKAMHPHPSARFPSCKAFISALRAVCKVKRDTQRIRVKTPA